MGTNNVVQIKAAPVQLESEKKWGAAVMSHGQCILPSILLRAQARLLVTSTEMIVLLHLIEHWWTADSKVFPSMQTIADRMDMTSKTVQRTIDSLVGKGLINKKNRTLPNGGRGSNEYTFNGLIQKLKIVERDFAEARRLRKAAAKPGGLKANKKT